MLQQVFRSYNVESKHFALSVSFNLQSSFSSLFKSTLNILHLDLSDVFLLLHLNITFPELVAGNEACDLNKTARRASFIAPGQPCSLM